MKALEISYLTLFYSGELKGGNALVVAIAGMVSLVLSDVHM